MTVYIKNVKNGLRDIRENVVKIVTFDDGRIKITFDNEGSWLTISEVHHDCMIEKVIA